MNNSLEERENRKRKACTPTFNFKANSICISLFVPIETFEKKSKTTTCPPSSNTFKELQYSLIGHIASSENKDDEFLASFTLSKFRSDLMSLAISNLPSEYGIKTKSLGKRCKLYFQKQWNSSAWCKLSTTDDLHQNLKDQMSKKGRVSDKILQLKVSFGKAKKGENFASQKEFDDYILKPVRNSTNGDGSSDGSSDGSDELMPQALLFSQEEIPSSPYKKKAGNIARQDSRSNTTRIMDMITSLYTTESCYIAAPLAKWP